MIMAKIRNLFRKRQTLEGAVERIPTYTKHPSSIISTNDWSLSGYEEYARDKILDWYPEKVRIHALTQDNVKKFIKKLEIQTMAFFFLLSNDLLGADFKPIFYDCYMKESGHEGYCGSNPEWYPYYKFCNTEFKVIGTRKDEDNSLIKEVWVQFEEWSLIGKEIPGLPELSIDMKENPTYAFLPNKGIYFSTSDDKSFRPALKREYLFIPHRRQG